MNDCAGARVDADDDRRDAGLVGLRHGLVGQHVLHRDGDDLADVGARVVRARADTGLPGSGLSTQPFGTTSLICSKKPSFFGISGSIIAAIWPTV